MEGAGSNMIPTQFDTQRLSVSNWQPEIDDKALRHALEAELAHVLTPAVLEHLPPSMQFEDGVSDLPSWIEERCAESDVLLVRQKQDDQIIGLMILAFDRDESDLPTIHLGYLISERAWGQGYATELLNGFVTACRPGPAVRLVAGVERSNPASARVLQKAGFVLLLEQPAAETEMYFRDIN